MASAVRPFITRRAVIPQLNIAPKIQRRHARALDVRFLQTQAAPRILETYREKLEARIKSEGVGSFEELREVYKDRIEKVRKESVPPSPTINALLRDPPPPLTAKVPPTPSPPSIQLTEAKPANAAPPGVKTLSSFVDVDKLAAHSDSKEIEFIWRARFLEDKNSLCAVIPKDIYTRLEQSARRYPMFILPLPRDSGAEMHLLQWTFPTPHTSTIILTSLAEYKLRGEFAVPHTALSHHLELVEDKGVALAQGAVTPDRGVTADEARWLVMALQKFYGALEDDESGVRRRKLLEMFSKGDGGFKVESLIEEVEKWG